MLTCGIRNETIRERLLQEQTMTSDKAIKLCQVLESAKARSHAIGMGQSRDEWSSEEQRVDAINTAKQQNAYRMDRTGERSNVKYKEKTITNCSKCGKSEHPVNKCPAFEKTCNFCKLQNNFATVCYKKRNADKFKQENINKIQRNNVESLNNEVNSLYIGSINLKQIQEICQEIGEVTTQWRTSLFVNNKEINFKIDSGAMVNILPYKLFKLAELADGIKSTSTVLNSYTGDKLNVMG